MELKPYDKSWMPAFKGLFLVLFGIFAMLRITGTIKSLAILFIFLIAMIGVLLVFTGVRFKNSRYRVWTIISGIIHLAFVIFLTTKVDTAENLDSAREGIVLFILIWIIYYSFTELIESAILYSFKNAFTAIFLINALLSLLFGYFLYIVSGEFTSQGVFYLGLMALVFGIVNVLSSYLLSRVNT